MKIKIKQTECDICVIGGGPAGYSAALRASQLGARVILAERRDLGGTCLNRGCIPTKFLWQSLNFQKKIKRASDFGITAPAVNLSFASVIEKKTKTVDLLVKNLRGHIEKSAIKILHVTASLAGCGIVEYIEPGTGEKIHIKAAGIIIAAGSSPNSIPGLTVDHETIIDSDDFFLLKELPKSLLVIGGGAIGVELAAIASGFGCEVTLAEKQPHILPAEDAELAGEVKKTLLRQGVKVLEGEQGVSSIAKSFEKVLVATGRKPNTDALTLENAGVKYSKQGIEVNDFIETSAKGIYAAGDVNGRSYLAYTAQGEGITAAENALGQKNSFGIKHIPKAVFSFPPSASAGAKEQDCAASDISIGRSLVSANSKAFIEGERSGFVKVICDKQSGRLLGVQMAGPDAENLITTAALAIKNGLSAADLSRELFFHPATAETLYEACQDALGKSIERVK
ncbi:MAG TPA: hypothetical protein DEE98_05875 [Elusimicrobia bacterium]|nr:MAG: hypothetical protein A2278_04095 [Elusimicrobia bacterium RIFOXYA12_FULL_49_49]OGS15340.1 MAG: hypothetical protein A2251_07410 [Elusimicrobia bacterium RIFOXYA2_FULL_47_53]OGS26470.1 MAG: hypothetical protein A2339_01745 [Elusimicrobia bacterium RIFOXYB12_FULL_50_12]OGS30595.1 MAG: hypothetical protein A2323_02530 [Elusimicrobia bacterium RIFOXYB2_FULL_46_23]HBU69896.1 hypothetical protein [Elusimicrobiota bacterium]